MFYCKCREALLRLYFQFSLKNEKDRPVFLDTETTFSFFLFSLNPKYKCIQYKAPLGQNLQSTTRMPTNQGQFFLNIPALKKKENKSITMDFRGL